MDYAIQAVPDLLPACSAQSADVGFHQLGRTAARRLRHQPAAMAEQEHRASSPATRRYLSDFAVGSLVVPVVFEGYAPASSIRPRRVRGAHAVGDGRDVGRPPRPSTRAMGLRRMTNGEPSGPPPLGAPPDTHGLPPRQLMALCELLATHTNTPELCLWRSGWLWMARCRLRGASPTLRLDQRTFLVRQGPLGLALAVGRGGPNGGISLVPPDLIWPAIERGLSLLIRTWNHPSSEDRCADRGGVDASRSRGVACDDWRLVAIGSDGMNAE